MQRQSTNSARPLSRAENIEKLLSIMRGLLHDYPGDLQRQLKEWREKSRLGKSQFFKYAPRCSQKMQPGRSPEIRNSGVPGVEQAVVVVIGLRPASLQGADPFLRAGWIDRQLQRKVSIRHTPGPDPKDVREVFQGDPEVLHSGEANSLFTATVGRHSVLVFDGTPHARQRRILVPPLKGERMRAFFDAMRLETLEAVRTWPVGTPFATLPTMRRVTLRVILRSGMGLAPGPESDRLERKMEKFLSNGRQRYALVLMTIIPIERLTGSGWVPLFRQLRDLDDELFAFIAARRKGDNRSASQNVLDDLLAANHEDGTPLDDREVRDALITILIAGHETTALALSWAISEIAQRQSIVDRLYDELVRVTGGGPLEAEHLPALDYLDATIREGLRFRSVVPFVVRKTMQPFSAGGREYPAGVVLCPCSHLVHRREDLYPEAGQFRPERFLERKFGPHEWFPFGGGNRVCLGMPFALYEMKVLLATLLSQVHPSRPTSFRSRPRRYGIVLGPDDGGRVLVRQQADQD